MCPQGGHTPQVGIHRLCYGGTTLKSGVRKCLEAISVSWNPASRPIVLLREGMYPCMLNSLSRTTEDSLSEEVPWVRPLVDLVRRGRAPVLAMETGPSALSKKFSAELLAYLPLSPG